MVVGSRVAVGPVNPAKGFGKAMVGDRIPFEPNACAALCMPTKADEKGPSVKPKTAL